MDKNIKVHIKDRVAVAEGDPVIICGNSDYTVTFSFDEEWGEAKAKTARFKFRTFDGPAHIDQPFEGDTVAVPELSNVREVEVGVYVGDLNTTTGASIRCKPCIRCGGGAPKDPTPDVYDELMALINKMGGGAGGLPVVGSLPENPEAGDVAILSQTAVVPWDKVRVWNNDVAPYKEGGLAAICEGLPSSGTLRFDLPEKLDLSKADKTKLFASGVVAYGEGKSLQLSVANIYGDQNALMCVFADQDGNVFMYHEAGNQAPTEGWYAQIDGKLTSIPIEELKLPDISGLKVLDLLCTLPPDQVAQFGAFVIPPDLALDVFSQLGAVVNFEGVYKAEENHGATEWELWLKDDQDELAQLTAQVNANSRIASEARTKANEAAAGASAANFTAKSAANTAETAASQANQATEKAAAALNNSLSACQTASGALETADESMRAISALQKTVETLSTAVEGLQTEVSGYSAFLEEINGEVVDNE